MPKRISVKESKKFYYAYKLGNLKDKVYYSKINEAEGQFTTYNGGKKSNYYGEEFEYNATIILEEKIKHINTFTKFWIISIPISVEEEPTHKIIRIGDIKDGLYTVYLKSTVSNVNNLWYEYDGNVLEIDVFFDFDTLTAKIPKSNYCEINYMTKVWFTEPESVDSLQDRLKVDYIEETDDCWTITFTKVE